MNVFRISNNQRIISTPSAFKSMDPSRLKRHFDWESKSSLPLDTKDNEVAAFPLLSFYSHHHVRGDCQLEVISPNLSLAGLMDFSLLFYFFWLSNCSHTQNYEQINHICQYHHNCRTCSILLRVNPSQPQWLCHLASWQVMTCDIIMGMSVNM